MKDIKAYVKEADAQALRYRHKIFNLEQDADRYHNQICNLEAIIDDRDATIDTMKAIITQGGECDCNADWDSAGCDDKGRKLKRCNICDGISVR